MKIALYIIIGLIFGTLFPSFFDDSAPIIRQIALVVILMRVGLALDFGALRRVGRAAILLSLLPASLEILGMVAIAPIIFGVSPLDALIMGCVVAAVSPAVIVPRMLKLIDNYNNKGARVAQVVMAAGSFDDLFVIVLFSLAIAFGADSTLDLSLVSGLLLSLFFSLFISIIVLRRYERVAKVSKSALSKLWLPFEPLLFISVGAQVDINYALSASGAVLLTLTFVVAWRLIGAYISTAKSGFSPKERIFCMISYTPKATVQAAIGAIPLSLGLACGELTLSMAVIAILVTAPLGALLIDLSAPQLLNHD